MKSMTFCWRWTIRRLALLVSLLGLIGVAHATVTVGQIGTYSNIAAATPFSTTATGSATTTGSGFIVAIGITSATVTVTAVTDTFSNTYTHLTPIVDSGSNAMTFDRWYCANGTGGASHQATVTLSASTAVFAALIEVKGAATTGAAFYSASGHSFYEFSTSSPYATSLAVAPPTTGAMLVSCFTGSSTTGAASAPTLTESSGFTIIGQTNNQGGGIVPAIGYRVVTGTATYTPSWTMATPAGVAGDVTIDSFLGPAAGGAVQQKLSLLGVGS